LCAICLIATLAFAAPQGQGGATATGGAPGQGRGVGRGPGQVRGRGILSDRDHPVLKIGSPAPDFLLPGVDGKMHSLKDYANAKILAVVFESNHCPVSIAYEERIRKIYEDYKDKGIAFIAINPNNPGAVRLDELGYTDSTDSMDAMKIRAKLRHIEWPYLYDGETQVAANKLGAVATPHIFIFDQARKLRYEGRIDDSTKISDVKKSDARDAIDALLAGKPIENPTTPAFGCSTKWLTKATDVQDEMDKIKAEPVNLNAATADDLKKLRADAMGKTLILNFWSTKCKECMDEFHGYQTTFRMYRRRKVQFATISLDSEKDQAAAMDFLKKEYASTNNLQFTGNAKDLQDVMGTKWNFRDPFVLVIGPDGKIAYQKSGKADILEVRRNILATIPNDGPWFGVQEYWTSVLHGN
jgi:peroxiredoxin